MKKLSLIILLLAVSLTGCFTNSAKTMTFSALPAEFADCKIVRVTNEYGEALNLARCPNSTTSAGYKQSKNTRSTIVVDGTTYEATK